MLQTQRAGGGPTADTAQYSSMTATWSGSKLYLPLRTIRQFTVQQWCCNPQLVSVFCILGHVTPDTTKVATLLPAADNAVITSSGSYLWLGGGSVYLADGSLGGHTHRLMEPLHSGKIIMSPDFCVWALKKKSCNLLCPSSLPLPLDCHRDHKTQFQILKMF